MRSVGIVLLFALACAIGVWAAPSPAGGPSATAAPSASPAEPEARPSASPSVRTLRVALVPVTPFVMRKPDGSWDGFAIDLWREMSKELHVDAQFIEVAGIEGMLEAVSHGQADVGLSAVSITAQRDRVVDFTQPFYDGGLAIAIPYAGTNQGAWQRAVAALWTPEMLHLPILFLLLIIVPAHFVWFVERSDPESIVARSYFPGIFDACYWAASTLSTQAEHMPRSAYGRVIAVAWMFCGILFTSYFTAVVTTAMTVQQLQSGITSPNDLVGKRIATVRDSTASQYLHDHGLVAIEEPQLREAVADLLGRRVQAIVFDSPALLYDAAHDDLMKIRVVAVNFQHENYGLVVPQGSPLRKQLDAAILTLTESGVYSKLYNRWFPST